VFFRNLDARIVCNAITLPTSPAPDFSSRLQFPPAARTDGQAGVPKLDEIRLPIERRRFSISPLPELFSALIVFRSLLRNVEAVGTDDTEAGLGDIAEEAIEEVAKAESHRLALVVTMVFVAKRNGFIGEATNLGVGDRAATDIAREISDDTLAVGIALGKPNIPLLLIEQTNEVLHAHFGVIRRKQESALFEIAA